MSITLTNKSISTKVAAVALGVVLAAGLLFTFVTPAEAASLTESQISSIIGLLQSFGADQATINNVNSSLRGQASPGTGSTGTSGACPALTRDLQLGSSGEDVKALQMFLNSSATTQVASAGAGSPGNESTYFGGLTKAAAMKFQAANNVSPIAGYVGRITRAAIAAVCCGVVVTPPPGTTLPPATGTGLSVSTTGQPANTLAVYNAARVPFTRFTLTAGNDGDVLVNSVTVERTGLAVDANFAGATLIDESTGMQLGIAKTLGSNHQAAVGEAFTVPRGTSKTFVVAANMGTAANVNGGETGSFDVKSINTASAIVSGSLPIRGATHTMNDTLTIGTISDIARGPLDPGNNATKEVGTTGYTFNSLRLTVGSQEDVRLYSVRWNQASSTGAADLANIVTVVDGTTYQTTVSSDGKYYSTMFPGGLLIAKGLSKEISVKGDIVSGSGRAASFVIEKNT